MAACTGEHQFGSDGVCQRCSHWDPKHHTDPVHLWTGMLVCGKPKSWCEAEIVVVGAQVRNATDVEERCTCQPCKDAVQRARDQYARPR